MPDKIKVAIVGLGFGAEFIPIYQRHPDTELWAICQRSEDNLNRIGDEFGVERRFTSYEALLEEPDLDAVHINSPIAAHAPMSLAALNAGKHTACTVPMATTVDECLQIVDARERSGKVYMMMETAIYTREFLYARDLVESGKLGKIQFLRGSHQQNMGLPGWPSYWYGFPPMHYATHAVSPLLLLAGARAKSVVCFGSGRIKDEYAEKDNSPSPSEPALMELTASTPTAPSIRLKGSRRTGTAPRSTPASRTRNASRCRTSRTCCPRRSRSTRRAGSTMRSTSIRRSSTAAATAECTRTWCTSSF